MSTKVRTLLIFLLVRTPLNYVGLLHFYINWEAIVTLQLNSFSVHNSQCRWQTTLIASERSLNLDSFFVIINYMDLCEVFFDMLGLDWNFEINILFDEDKNQQLVCKISDHSLSPFL
jgi:hypothetical protein